MRALPFLAFYCRALSCLVLPNLLLSSLVEEVVPEMQVVPEELVVPEDQAELANRTTGTKLSPCC